MSSQANFGAKVPLTVQSGGVNSNLKGIEYQIKTMLLAIIKSFQNPNNTDFEISTEIKETEPFDDVILKIEGKASRFIQCKAKENSMVLSFNDFFDKRNKNFYLTKYFKGYINIKKHFKKTGDFVISTNNSIPKNKMLLHGVSNDKLVFFCDTENDEIFGNFQKRFKLEIHCQDTKESIRRRLIEDMSTNNDASNKVDRYLDGFLSDLVFVLDMKIEDIDREIDEFIQNHFNLSIVDYPKSILMWALYNWTKNMKTANSINRTRFGDYLKQIKDNCEIIPKVIERSAVLFRSSKFEFKICTKVNDFIMQKFKVTINNYQLFYMQLEDGDTFYGSCMINQMLRGNTSDEFLFLSTKSPFDIEDGLKMYALENLFNFLIFVESKEKPIQYRQKDLIKNILTNNNRKRVLVITDQIKLQFAADLIANDENLLKIQEVKLSNLTTESLESFLLEKHLKFQDEKIKLSSILDSSDQSLIDSIYLKDLEAIQSIGHNVIEGKNFDPFFFIPRTLKKQNVVKTEIVSKIEEKENERIARIEGEFVACCNQFPDDNVHLLQNLDHFNFIWKKSRGKINCLLDYVNTQKATPWNSQANTEKTMILVDVPGMGKTSWLNNLAQELKIKHKNHFIINISFNDYTEYFERHKFENEESVLRFFETEVLKLGNDTEKKLFRSACTKTGKIQIILDGLDEVCPESEAEMLKMIGFVSNLKTSGIYISTRPELKRILEVKLQNFSHKFEPFSEENQEDFLFKFWSKDRQGNLTDDELLAVVEKVVFLVNKKKELSEITGIPLITKIVAEIFDSELISKATTDDSVVIDAISNLSNLYEVFVDKKIERYLTEKLRLDLSIRTNRRTAKTEKRRLIQLYKKMALKLIFPQHLIMFNENFQFTPDELEDMRKCGLILNDSEIKFIHRTVAEYFVSLAIQEKLGDEKTAHFVVIVIFCVDKFKVIRSFLNYSIDKFEGDLTIHGQHLVKCPNQCAIASKLSCEEENSKILEFIFKSLFAFKTEPAIKLALKVLSSDDFLERYMEIVNDNLNIFELVEKELGLETLINLILNCNFQVLKLSFKNPLNCHSLLSMIRQKFDDTGFWGKFQENQSILLSQLLNQNFDRDIFLQILNEISQIESEKNINCFENFGYLLSKFIGFDTDAVTHLLLYLLDAKGFQEFMKIIFVIKNCAPSQVHLNLVDNFSNSLLSLEFSFKRQLFGSLETIAFGQLLRRSNSQNQNYCKELREKLMSKKFWNFNELQNLPEILKIADGNVEFVNETALVSFGCLYFYRNGNDPQVVQLFLHELLDSDSFDFLLYPIIKNHTQFQKSLGRFMFDHLSYENVASNSGLRSLKDFFLKLKNKQFELYSWFKKIYGKDFLESFIFFLFHSLIYSMKTEDDTKKINLILSSEELDWSGYFIGFWRHCKQNFPFDFDFDLNSVYNYGYDFNNFEIEDIKMVLKLVQWIIEKYGNNHPALQYRDDDGNTLLIYSAKAGEQYLEAFSKKVSRNRE